VHTAVGLAEQVRLDRVYRCAAAFRLVGVPPAPLSKCATDFWRGPAGWQAGSEAWFTVGGSEYQVAVGEPVPVSVNAVVGGRAVEMVHPSDGSPATLAIRYPYAGRTAYFWVFFGPADDEVVNALVAGFTPRPDGDPDHWPSSPFE
jgi:hypothetical protein